MQLIAQTVAVALQQAGIGQDQNTARASPTSGSGKKMIDTKAVRIRDFDGVQSNWEPWNHSFKSAIRSACPEVLAVMEEVEKMSLDAKDENLEEYDDIAKMSGELYNVLSQFCTGEALTVIKGVTTLEGCGRGRSCTRSSTRRPWHERSGS